MSEEQHIIAKTMAKNRYPELEKLLELERLLISCKLSILSSLSCLLRLPACPLKESVEKLSTSSRMFRDWVYEGKSSMELS